MLSASSALFFKAFLTRCANFSVARASHSLSFAAHKAVSGAASTMRFHASRFALASASLASASFAFVAVRGSRASADTQRCVGGQTATKVIVAHINRTQVHKSEQSRRVRQSIGLLPVGLLLVF